MDRISALSAAVVKVCLMLCILLAIVRLFVRAGYELCSSGVSTMEVNTTSREMNEPCNTWVCCFDPASPRPTAFDVHEWIHSQLQVSKHSISMILIDGIRRQVYIRFIALSFVHDILRATNGENVYKPQTGEISPVILLAAGMESKRLRLAILPPEVASSNIRAAISQSGTYKTYRKEPGRRIVARMCLMG
jgi:hypothetical protein